MKKHWVPVLPLIVIGGSLSCSAQEVISTQGETLSNSQGSISYSVGEVVINTETDGDYDITQGFHQANWTFVGIEDFSPSYEASIFPNPTSELLNIKTELFDDVEYLLYDVNGKQILKGKLTGKQTSIQVNHLSTGSYSLTLRNEEQNLKTFKLVKSN